MTPSAFPCRQPISSPSAASANRFSLPIRGADISFTDFIQKTKFSLMIAMTFYGEEFLKEYLKAIRLTPDWDSFLNARRVKWVLVPARSSLANMLEQTSQWTTTYQDNTAVLFERKP